MPPRKSKTPRRSASHSDISGTSRTNGDVPHRFKTKADFKTDWSTVDTSNFSGFSIRYDSHIRHDKKPNAAKKRKLEEPEDEDKDENGNPLQRNPFEGTSLPDTRYTVKPTQMWEDTSRYRKFTIQNETFTVNDLVFIKASEDQDPDPDSPIQGWVAKVLEVRAGDEQHVYLRIYWMYRPEDLPMGRQPYHGKNELIASNSMQIIDATTVQAKAFVKHWVEQDNKGEVLDGDQMFWRQTLDVSKDTKKGGYLSELTKHCIDETPCNPDRLLIQCSRCDRWLHGACVEKDAVRNAYKSHDIPYPGEEEQEEEEQPESSATTETSCRPRRSSGVASTNGSTPKSTPQRTNSKRSRPKRGLLARVAAAVGLADSPSDLLFSAQVIPADSSKTKLILTDLRPGQANKTWEEPLKCLLCKGYIEEGDGESESERGVSVKEAKKEQEDEDNGEASTSQTLPLEWEKKDSVVKEEEANTPNNSGDAALELEPQTSEDAAPAE